MGMPHMALFEREEELSATRHQSSRAVVKPRPHSQQRLMQMRLSQWAGPPFQGRRITRYGGEVIVPQPLEHRVSLLETYVALLA